ncbi:MBL fold metallo-hydrolase [Deltaproteobacteria bacterium TL4]
MKVHHLNCATLCPSGFRLQSAGELLFPAHLVCHCLLIESNQGLILVDTGLGLQDIYNPERLGTLFRVSTGPRLAPEETALRQIKALGFQPEEVRHIVVTHLDLDHAGGISDFPKARIHIFSEEYTAAQPPHAFKDQSRYVEAQWKYHTEWDFHFVEEGERWFGFERIQMLLNVAPEVLLIPLQGHTRGHCAVAVQTPQGWLLHCGDAYVYHGEVDPHHYHCPPAFSLLQRFNEFDREMRLHNQQRLRALVREHSSEVRIFCAHDPKELSDFQN